MHKMQASTSTSIDDPIKLAKAAACDTQARKLVDAVLAMEVVPADLAAFIRAALRARHDPP